ncbi:MAG TPA: hypothetical protein VHR84_05195 [Terriglobales bacterium]|jgi:hypothetical protein|nr:hypothetical protein [Terriglobales bacterium]
MQTLNVRAGQTDEEYQAAAEQQRNELRSDSIGDANLFFVAAGLAALGTGLLPIRLNFIVSVGLVDLLTLYGRPLGAFYPIAVTGVAILWVLVMCALGFAGRAGQRWAFLLGMILYATDMILLMLTFSIWAFGLHAFFVFRWFQGQNALKNLHEQPIESTS